MNVFLFYEEIMVHTMGTEPDRNAVKCSISDETWEKWKRVLKEFEDVQDRMSECYRIFSDNNEVVEFDSSTVNPRMPQVGREVDHSLMTELIMGVEK